MIAAIISQYYYIIQRCSHRRGGHSLGIQSFAEAAIFFLFFFLLLLLLLFLLLLFILGNHMNILK